jgi:hypothetical protein
VWSRQRTDRDLVDKLADIAGVFNTADPNDKSEIFRQLGLTLDLPVGNENGGTAGSDRLLMGFRSVQGLVATERRGSSR